MYTPNIQANRGWAWARPGVGSPILLPSLLVANPMHDLKIMGMFDNPKIEGNGIWFPSLVGILHLATMRNMKKKKKKTLSFHIHLYDVYYFFHPFMKNGFRQTVGQMKSIFNESCQTYPT